MKFFHIYVQVKDMVSYTVLATGKNKDEAVQFAVDNKLFLDKVDVQFVCGVKEVPEPKQPVLGVDKDSIVEGLSCWGGETS